MRIGIVTGEYLPMQGGVGAYSRILAGELARQGQSVFVFASDQAREDQPQITLTNMHGWGPGSLRSVVAWARQHRLDVVNIQFQTAAFGMSPWIHFLPDALRGLPVVTTFHDLRYPYLFPKAGRLRDWIVNHLARASAGVIATNHEDLSRLQTLSRAALIPIGSNILQPLPADFDPHPWRAQAGAQSGDFLLAYFGLFNHSKGLDTLLTALATLRRGGLPARLVFVGGGAGSSDPTNVAFMTGMTALINRLDLTPCIHYTGYLDEAAVGAYLTASDVVVLPFADGASYRRGSLMAAIHYGCAVVTTTPQVTISTFKPDENLMLVPPDDSTTLASTLRHLRESPELAARLRQGAAVLADSFRWDTIAQNYVSFLYQLGINRS